MDGEFDVLVFANVHDVICGIQVKVLVDELAEPQSDD